VWRRAVVALVLVIVSLPISAVLTLALLPFWRWLEARYGIESVGHSGPSDWCFIVIFIGCVVVAESLFVVIAARARRQSRTGR
jgi:hypothetical protein